MVGRRRAWLGLGFLVACTGGAASQTVTSTGVPPAATESPGTGVEGPPPATSAHPPAGYGGDPDGGLCGYDLRFTEWALEAGAALHVSGGLCANGMPNGGAPEICAEISHCGCFGVGNGKGSTSTIYLWTSDTDPDGGTVKRTWYPIDDGGEFTCP